MISMVTVVYSADSLAMGNKIPLAIGVLDGVSRGTPSRMMTYAEESQPELIKSLAHLFPHSFCQVAFPPSLPGVFVISYLLCISKNSELCSAVGGSRRGVLGRGSASGL